MRSTALELTFNFDKIVTNNNLRYIIPMNNETGLIMISYTDDVYTKIWKKHENNENALKKIIVKLVKETFSINIGFKLLNRTVTGPRSSSIIFFCKNCIQVE